MGYTAGRVPERALVPHAEHYAKGTLRAPFELCQWRRETMDMLKS